MAAADLERGWVGRCQSALSSLTKGLAACSIGDLGAGLNVQQAIRGQVDAQAMNLPEWRSVSGGRAGPLAACSAIAPSPAEFNLPHC